LAVAVAKDYTGPYDAACYYSLMFAETATDSDAVRAVQLLAKCIEWGFNDVRSIDQDSDFDAIRNRDDFKKLLAPLRKSKERDSATRPAADRKD
jgi:hypothetical protein